MEEVARVVRPLDLDEPLVVPLVVGLDPPPRRIVEAIVGQAQPLLPRPDSQPWDHDALADLRHAAVTQMIAVGVPLAIVAGVAGHADLAFTVRQYGHLRPEHLREAADAMDKAYGVTPDAKLLTFPLWGPFWVIGALFNYRVTTLQE
jgi:hypothetical protein